MRAGSFAGRSIKSDLADVGKICQGYQQNNINQKKLKELGRQT